MGFIYSQLFARLPYPTASQAGKTVCITGSNTGLGKEAAKHFARLGAARLILAVRTVSKGEAAKTEIENETKCGKDVVQVWELDMGSFESIKKFSKRVNEELDRLDIFMANAGLARSGFKLVEGFEETMTVNVISTFLLAGLVLPKLKQTAKAFGVRPTLSLTASDAHAHSTFPQKDFAPEGKIFETLSDKEVYEKHGGEQYPLSKMLEIFIVRSIGEQSPQQTFPVTINCANPGLCMSELARDTPGLAFWLLRQVLARTTEQGSRTIVNGGLGDASTHGQYLSDCAVAQPAPIVTENKDVQDRLWRELGDKLEKISPGVMANFKA